MEIEAQAQRDLVTFPPSHRKKHGWDLTSGSLALESILCSIERADTVHKWNYLQFSVLGGWDMRGYEEERGETGKWIPAVGLGVVSTSN